jgi:hypothetical protein
VLHGSRRYMSDTPPVMLPPDPVIEVYKKDIDRTLLRENLKLAPSERLRKLQEFMRAMLALRAASGRRPT